MRSGIEYNPGPQNCVLCNRYFHNNILGDGCPFCVPDLYVDQNPKLFKEVRKMKFSCYYCRGDFDNKVDLSKFTMISTMQSKLLLIIQSVLCSYCFPYVMNNWTFPDKKGAIYALSQLTSGGVILEYKEEIFKSYLAYRRFSQMANEKQKNLMSMIDRVLWRLIGLVYQEATGDIILEILTYLVVITPDAVVYIISTPGELMKDSSRVASEVIKDSDTVKSIMQIECSDIYSYINGQVNNFGLGDRRALVWKYTVKTVNYGKYIESVGKED